MVKVVIRTTEFSSISFDARFLSLRNENSSCLDFLAKCNYFHTIFKSHIALTMVTKQFVYTNLRQTVVFAGKEGSAQQIWLYHLPSSIHFNNHNLRGTFSAICPEDLPLNITNRQKNYISWSLHIRTTYQLKLLAETA